MALSYPNDYSVCFDDENKASPLIRLHRLSKGEEISIDAKEDKIIFLIEGDMSFNVEKYDYQDFSKEQMILLAAQTRFIGKASSDSLLVIIIISDNLQLFNCFPLDKLIKEPLFDYHYKFTSLDIKAVLKDYLLQLIFYLTSDIDAAYFQSIKIPELFFILLHFYSKKEQMDFFYPLLSQDRHFSQQVLNALPKAKNAKELSNAMHYSYSGFIKRFKKVFGVPVYTWMKQRKALLVYNEITSSEKSLSQISEEFGFSSQGRFSDFCKSEFKMTATQIRNKRKNIRD